MDISSKQDSVSLLPQSVKLLPKQEKGKIIVLAGPTATGKTEISLEIARILNGEIISADSMQVYRGMDIGTAKVSKKHREEIPHHLIDIQDIDTPFNVVDFCHAAFQAIHKILAAGHVPIVVGGTGFYIHSLLYGPPMGPPSVPSLRKSLENEMEKFGAELLFDKLRKLDPEYAKTITFRDKQKIVRGLEIISLTNQRVSDFKNLPSQISQEWSQYNFRCWFIYYPREILYPKIEQRCEKMLQDGLLKEIRHLLDAGLKENQTASQAIGYKQGIEYLEGPQTEKDYQEFVRKFKTASRQYAKRQFTWFKKESSFRWMNLEDLPKELLLEYIIQDYEHS
ncbi:MAG: tRNA (adenosine(37)-N6)-dimethylallyltransferase MiaA [Simkaniaceae bacterium]